jgi:hypothetical protein
MDQTGSKIEDEDEDDDDEDDWEMLRLGQDENSVIDVRFSRTEIRLLEGLAKLQLWH